MKTLYLSILSHFFIKPLILLALKAAGILPEDEVITVSHSALSTALS